MDTFIETTMDSENQRISTQSIQLHTDYRTLGYNKQQAQACVKQYQKDYANIRGLTYQASVTDKEMKQLLVLKLTDIDTAQLKKLDFIQTLEDAVFDVHTAVVVYEQQGTYLQYEAGGITPGYPRIRLTHSLYSLYEAYSLHKAPALLSAIRDKESKSAIKSFVFPL